MLEWPPHMETAVEQTNHQASEEAVLRVYEAGYQISPSVKEEDLDQVVGTIRALVEKSGGSFVAEGAPAMMKLAFTSVAREAGKQVEYDRAYFGWLKFEASSETAGELESALRANPLILRSVVFRTVREDTRAKFKAPTLREVKRTDTIKPTAKKAEETSGPVSEEDLDKALESLTTD